MLAAGAEGGYEELGDEWAWGTGCENHKELIKGYKERLTLLRVANLFLRKGE